MAQSISDMSVTWPDGSTYNGIKLNVNDAGPSSASSLLMDLQVGSASKFKVTKAGDLTIPSGQTIVSDGTNNAALALVNGFGLNAGFVFKAYPGLRNGLTFYPDGSGEWPLRFISSGSITWTDSGSNALAGNRDLTILRDAANTLAQRNGANAQTFRIYNNFSTSSDFERGFMRWSSNVLEIGSEVGGTFTTARTLKLVNPTTIQITPSNAVLQIDANVRPTSNGSNNLGTDSVRWATTFTANVVQSGYQELAEMTAPAAPAADRVRIYAQDNGSGKTQLMALFATGAAVQIAIEP